MTEDSKMKVDVGQLIELYEADKSAITFAKWWIANEGSYELHEDEIMPRLCPRCDKLITELIAWEQTQLKKLPVKENKKIEWTWKDTAESDLQDQFECPDCHAILFKDWENAEAWLLNPTGKSQPQDHSYKSYASVSVCIDDIMMHFKDHAHLQEAAKYLDGWVVQRIASKIGDALLEGGCYKTGIEIWSQDYLEEAYEKNKEKIHRSLQCTLCRLNPNDSQDEDQQIVEMQFIKEEGMCSACQNEHAETVHGAITVECYKCQTAQHYDSSSKAHEDGWWYDAEKEKWRCYNCDVEETP